MKKMKKTFLAGTAFAVSAAAALTMSGCDACIQGPVETVYGPPEWFEKSAPEDDVSRETTLGIEIETDFSVEDEILEDVYGPPEWFESDNADD